MLARKLQPPLDISVFRSVTIAGPYAMEDPRDESKKLLFHAYFTVIAPEGWINAATRTSRYVVTIGANLLDGHPYWFANVVMREGRRD